MSVVNVPQVLRERLGSDGADALVDLVNKAIEEETRDVMARIDEKVVGRYADILRRVHEDIAGVEIRLTERMAAFEVRLGDRINRVEISVASLESRLLRWLVGTFIIQMAAMVVLAWASKRLF